MDADGLNYLPEGAENLNQEKPPRLDVMTKVIEIRWYLGADGSGHVTKVVRDGTGVAERMYAFESLNRDDQVPPRLASIIRQDGRSQALVSHESS